MRRPKVHALLICANRIVAAAAVVFLYGGMAVAQDVTTEITSNNIKILAGSRDTLWMVTQGARAWGVNYTLDKGKNWWGYYFSSSQTVADLAYGAGHAMVVLYGSWRGLNDSWGFSQQIWHYAHKNDKRNFINVSWPQTKDTTLIFETIDAVNADSTFYFASMDGGLLRWTPSGTLHAFKVGDTIGYSPSKFVADTGSARKSRRVQAVSAYQRDSTTIILVVTPAKIWLFSPSRNSWDTLSTKLANSGFSLQAFETAASDPTGANIQAFITVKEQSKDSVIKLFQYDTTTDAWVQSIDPAPRTFSFANNGLLYVVHEENQLKLYKRQDHGAVPSILTGNDVFRRRVATTESPVYPSAINDVLFTSENDTGFLWLATSLGLYLSSNEVPGSSTGPFTLIRHAREVSKGLKESYAVPGILSANFLNSGQELKVTFVYNLGRDARVTIRVYDFNMDLVKTVIKDRQRRAGLAIGRSTDPAEDTWDGTNQYGRPVAPGVYYYKITTDIGEHCFGKIIVAK